MASSISYRLVAILFTIATAQSTSYDICSWAQFRGAVVRDSVWMDGGLLWTSSNLVPLENVYYLNFSSSFDTTTTNLTSLLGSKPKPGTNITPRYVGGTMFANDLEFYLFGGLEDPSTASGVLPDQSTNIFVCEIYNNTPGRTQWAPFEFNYDSVASGNMTVYVTDGAGANSPSENLGFYFSGMQNPTGGAIELDIIDASASVAVGSLIEVNMETPGKGIWTNHSIDDPTIIPRANAQLAWVPVATQGILVAVGGVINPEDTFEGALNSSQQQESMLVSPGFMKSIPVYDIANAAWYLQPATAGDDGYPPQLSSFCSTLAIAQDDSSFELYIYGGYDGLNSVDPPSDDVWILSMPAFRWIKAYNGNNTHGRSSHYCAQPYPNLMFTIGGVHMDQSTCIEGFIQVFNLNTLLFQPNYNPSVTDYQYRVPDKVSSVIGGDSMGGATMTANWVNPKLEELFNTQYTTPIMVYYPYSPTTGHTSHPWLVPVVAAIVGSLALTAIGLTIWYCCRRRNKKPDTEGSEYEIGSVTTDAHNRTTGWLRGLHRGMPDTERLHGVPKSEPSITTTEVDADHRHLPTAHEVEGDSLALGSGSPNNRFSNNNSVAGSSRHHRMQSERHNSSELGGTPQAYEMYDTNVAELTNPYYDEQHPRSIAGALGSGNAQHQPGVGVSRFSNPASSSELEASDDLNRIEVSPSLDGSHHPYSNPTSPGVRPSPEVELPPDNFVAVGRYESGTLHEQRPQHTRNISSMSNLPSPSQTADSEPMVKDIRPKHTFSQYQPDLDPEYAQDMPESPPTAQEANFDSGFGPDGQARSPSVLTRKPIGIPPASSARLASRPEGGEEREYFLPYDGPGR